MANFSNSDTEPTNIKRKTLLVLLCLYIINFSDRQLIAALSPLIKADFDLSDTELGVLKGFAYIVIYAFIGVPIAHLADRFSRKKIILISLTIWSSFTVFCSLAQNMSQLILARAGFGIGAAGSSPASHSLISTHYPPKSRGFALSIYNLGIPIGQCVAFFCGGTLAAFFGWRATLITFGLLGLAFVLTGKYIHEPESNSIPRKESSPRHSRNLYQSICALLTTRNFRLLCLTAALASFSVSGITAWVIDFFIRGEQFTYGQASALAGIMYGIFGSIGMLGGGFLSDRSGGASHPFFLRLPGISLVLCGPILFGALWTSSSQVSALLMTLTVTLLYSFQGPMFAYAQTIVPANLRATSASLLIFFINIAGAGMGPLIVGVISDQLQNTFNESTALKVALSVLCLSVMLAGASFLYIALREKRLRL